MNFQTDAAPDDPGLAPHIPVGAVLQRVGHELAHLARLLDQLEALLRPVIVEAARRNPELLSHMQGFDHIGQKAAALASFLEALEPAAAAHWLIDPTEAARAVTLADLAARLRLLEEGAKLRDATCGDCELF